MRKLTKAEVKFEHPARGMDRCRQCVYFQKPHGCKIVQGLIRPGDWCKKFKARRVNPRLVDAIRHGDRVTILVPAGIGRGGQEWKEATGRAVMRSATGGWVLNMGGPHGTPGLADDQNIVKVKPARRNPSKKALDKARWASALIVQSTFPHGLDNAPPELQAAYRTLRAATEKKPTRRRNTSFKCTRRRLIPEQHQLRIARDTLKMPDAMVGVMGGPSKAEAREIIRRLTGKRSRGNPTDEHKAMAYRLGLQAFEAGKKRIPAHDSNLEKLLGRVGASTPILEAWLKGWDHANLSKRNPALLPALVEGIGIGAGIFASERGLSAISRKSKQNPIPALIAALGEGAGLAAGEKAFEDMTRRKSVAKKKKKMKRVRINLDAFVDAAGTIHPIRGSEGYSDARFGKRRRGGKKRSGKKRSAKKHHKKVARRKGARGKKRNPRKRITHALAVRGRIIATGGKGEIDHAARLLRAAGVKPRIGRRV